MIVEDYTCILVFTTSKGVFPKTLAAPAVAPNIAVTRRCISRVGSSPGDDGKSLILVSLQSDPHNPLESLEHFKTAIVFDFLPLYQLRRRFMT